MGDETENNEQQTQGVTPTVAPSSENEVTVRKLSSVITSLWTKVKNRISSDISDRAYTSNPEMNGTASPGTSTQWAKGDHVHPSDTSKEDVSHKTTTVRETGADDTNYPTEKAVREAINSKVASAYKAAGTKTVAELTSSLLVSANEGNVYNMTDSGTTTADFIEGAGKVIKAGDNVGICKVGDVYKFDLLSGFVDLSNYVQKSNTAGLIKNDGTIDTKNYLETTGNGSDVTATFSAAAERTNITTGEKLSVLFGKIAKWFSDLKALAFKDKVADADIDGTISDTHIASASTWNNKATKVSSATEDHLAALTSGGDLKDSGKKAADFAQSVKIGSGSELKDSSGNVVIPLAANSSGTGSDGAMSGADKVKLDGISENANKVESSQTNGNIKIDNAETTVYTHPTGGANTSKGDTTNQEPGFGSTFKALSAEVDSAGHTTSLNEHTVKIPDAVAVPSVNGDGGSSGLMSATDKEKLDELASGEAYKDRDEAVAAALNDLNARMKAAEDRADDPNIGSKTADELNVQKLLIGGKDIGDSLDGIGDSLDGKVDKVNGKGLSTNDFTTEYMNAVDANTQARHTHVYMTDAEIDALWDAAKSAASNAS